MKPKYCECDEIHAFDHKCSEELEEYERGWLCGSCVLPGDKRNG